MDDERLPKRVLFGKIVQDRVGDIRGKRRLAFKGPRCHRGTAEVYDRMEDGGRRETQYPAEEEDFQMAGEHSTDVHE